MERSVDILNELNEISPLVADAGNTNVFMVPQGYFETVTDTILLTIQDDVPAGYFDNLSTSILSKIEGTAAHELNEISLFVAGLKKVTPYEVPEKYFEQVSEEITFLTAEEKIPAILQGVNKIQAFEVPAGYFEQLASHVLKNVKEQGGAKVITMPRRFNSFWKYAAAAAFTGIIALGVYKYSGTSITANGDTAIAKMDDKKFNETIENLAEEDIIKYLEKNGSEADVAALASGIDEGNLPEQEEYFTDETTLDKFLEDIELKN